MPIRRGVSPRALMKELAYQRLTDAFAQAVDRNVMVAAKKSPHKAGLTIS